MFVFTSPKTSVHVPIRKARAKGITEQRSSQAIADARKKDVAGIFVSAVDEATDLVKIGNVEAAVITNNPDAVAALMPTAELTERMALVTPITQDAYNASATRAITFLPNTLADVAAFNQVAPRALEFIATSSAKRITDINTQARLAIRNTLSSSLRQGISARATARRLRDTVGLNERQAIALINFRTGLEEQGLTDALIRRRVEVQRNRFIAQRADTIARTELMTAVNEGRQELWMQLKDQDLIDESRAKRQWITARDSRVDCKVCEPMDKQLRNIDEPFTTGDGRQVMIPGEQVHPNDRCTIVLRFKG